MSKIVVHDLKKFIAPLKFMSNHITKIALNKVGDTFSIAARNEKGMQAVYLTYKSDTIQIVEGDIEKIGIYALPVFVSVLSIFGNANKLVLTIENNLLNIAYDEKQSVNYILSDLTLIDEAPAEIKIKTPFVITFDIGPTFIKKIKSILPVLDVSQLVIQGKDGKLNILLADKNKQSHSFKEIIGDTKETFEVALKVRDQKTDILSLLCEDCGYKMSVSSKLIQFVSTSTDYTNLTYFMAPTI